MKERKKPGQQKKNPNISRRHILAGSAGLAGVGILRGFNPALAEQSSTVMFTHGVASGDPLQDRVILWTRAVPADGRARNLDLTWQMSESPNFKTIAASGQATAGPKTDYTTKVDAAGLQPGRSYHYRFIAGSAESPVGRTRTLPAAGRDAFKLSIVSCSNYPQGFFHVYREIAKRDCVAVLHLGDYIYEYPEGTYSNEEMTEAYGRKVMPAGEVIALEDYRMRYGLYRSDPDLQAVHAAHPFICVWDDHEIANDTWRTGAENHNEGEGPFEARKKAALRAYHEWLPIRENQAGDQTTIYRSFEIGDLASLIMLDTRLVGRDKPLNYASDLPLRTMPFRVIDGQSPVAVTDRATREQLENNPETRDQIREIPVPFRLTDGKADPILDWSEIQKLDPENLPQGISYLPDLAKFKADVLPGEDRSMLGLKQQKWLDAQLNASKASGKPWQILGQQVLSGKVGIPMIADDDIDKTRDSYVTPRQLAEFRALAAMDLPLNLDAWDGYPAAREQLFASIRANANNAILLAGDTHNAWAFDLADKDGHSVAVEFATAGVSSPGMEEYLPVEPGLVTKAIMEKSPELKFLDSHRRGWLELTISADEVQASFEFVSSVRNRKYQVEPPVRHQVAVDAHKISTA